MAGRRTPRTHKALAHQQAPFGVRPLPPEELHEIALWDEDVRFAPAPDLVPWVRTLFIESIHTSTLQNEDHEHLALANLGFLWTNAKAQRQGRIILGTAEIFNPRGDSWVKARQMRQMLDWFGVLPSFIITLSAPYSHAAGDAEFCALMEHELYHCAQKVGEYGPRYDSQTGEPLWCIRGHDVEQFVGVVRRYGADAAGVRALVDAANQKPLLPAGEIALGCGTCLKVAA